MKKLTKRFMRMVIVIGMALGILCSYRFISSLIQGSANVTPYQVVFLVGLCALCRSFPIYMSETQALDVSVISVLNTYLISGVDAAVFVYLVSSFFSFDRERKTKKIHTIYNSPIEKTLFNVSNIVLSIVIPGFLCSLLGWSPGDLSFPFILLPTIIFSVLTFISNAMVVLAVFRINGDIDNKAMFHTVIGLTPNVMAAMPLGLLMALVFKLPSGPWFVILMLLPLMLARYSWKLFLEAQEQQVKLINALISTMEAKDEYTQGHSKRVEMYAQRIARAMGLRDKQIEKVRVGAVLHDIGKVGIDDSLLRKPGDLSPEERDIMNRHPIIGVGIIEHADMDQDILDMIKYHHERFDGRGHPDGLVGNQTPKLAQILSVADAFDAMTSDRPYRSGMPRDQALAIVRKESGKQFAPDVVEAFLKAMEDEEL